MAKIDRAEKERQRVEIRVHPFVESELLEMRLRDAAGALDQAETLLPDCSWAMVDQLALWIARLCTAIAAS